MPNRGFLFSDTNFKTSDINNHIIGMHGQILVQFFQYIPFPDAKFRTVLSHFRTFYYNGISSTPVYTIGVATLPKSYGHIVVLRKKLFSKFRPFGMKQVKTESVPAFIEKLSATGYRFNIEIVENILYIATSDKKADYQVMLQALSESFKQMKM
jgi:hypothetical protein